jgi:hypothetical protein
MRALRLRGVADELVEACRDAAKVFDLAEVSLDDIALAIERWTNGALNLPILLGGNVGASTPGGDQVDDGAGIVTAIGNEGLERASPIDQRFDSGFVGGLPRRQDDPQRQAVLIDATLIFVLKPPLEWPMA